MRLRTGSASRLLAFVLLAATLVLAGCTAGSGVSGAEAGAESGSSAAFPVIVTDDAGRVVEVAGEPQRIVSLAPANTEIVAALGIADRLVGVTTYCDYPPEVTSLPKIGDFITPNIEAITAAQPDLVLATTGVQADVLAQLEQTGAAVIAFDPQTLEQLYASLDMLGRATGRVEAADEIVTDMQSDLADISSAIADATPTRCFVEIAQDPLYTTGANTLLADLIEAAGGDNVVKQEGYVGYSLEQLLADDPDVYLATKGSMSDPADIDSRAGYQALAAVKAGRVHVLDDNLVSRPGPRVVEGVRQIAEALHPDAF